MHLQPHQWQRIDQVPMTIDFNVCFSTGLQISEGSDYAYLLEAPLSPNTAKHDAFI